MLLSLNVNNKEANKTQTQYKTLIYCSNCTTNVNFLFSSLGNLTTILMTKSRPQWEASRKVRKQVLFICCSDIVIYNVSFTVVFCSSCDSTCNFGKIHLMKMHKTFLLLCIWWACAKFEWAWSLSLYHTIAGAATVCTTKLFGLPSSSNFFQVLDILCNDVRNHRGGIDYPGRIGIVILFWLNVITDLTWAAEFVSLL